MKRITFAAAALILAFGLGTPTYAQEGERGRDEGAERGDDEGRRGRRGRRGRGGRGGWGGMNLEQMTKDLGLSEEQTAKLKSLQEEMQKQREEMMRKAREEGGDPREAFRGMREQFQKMREKMNEILTPEQREKWEKQREEMRNRWRRGGRGGREGRQQNFQRLRAEAIKSLALSEEESAVLVPLLDSVIETRKLLVEEGEKRRKEFLEKVRNTTAETELAALLQKYRADRDADRASLKKAQAKLTEVLTPTQEAKLVALNILD